MNKKIFACYQLMRLDKPVGTLLLLWPTLCALWIANSGAPKSDLLAIFIFGTLITRSAGCVINDFCDSEIDKYVIRTQQRPLAQNRISKKAAFVLFLILMFIAAILLLWLNFLAQCIALSAAAIMLLYPLMKRFISLPQVILGCAFSLSIPLAFAASINSVPLISWLLFIANCLWVIAYDTQYAIVDRKDDIKIGVKSSAILFGKYDLLAIGILQIITILLSVLIGILLDATYLFYILLAIAAGCFFYQYLLTASRHPTLCFRAFLNNQYVGLCFFCAFFLHYYH